MYTADILPVTIEIIILTSLIISNYNTAVQLLQPADSFNIKGLKESKYYCFKNFNIFGEPIWLKNSQEFEGTGPVKRLRLREILFVLWQVIPHSFLHCQKLTFYRDNSNINNQRISLGTNILDLPVHSYHKHPSV